MNDRVFPIELSIAQENSLEMPTLEYRYKNFSLNRKFTEKVINFYRTISNYT
jgi:hypothetical protein